MKRSSPRRSDRPAEEIVERYERIPDDLLAVAVGGAEGALELDEMPAGFGGGGAVAPSMMRSEPGGAMPEGPEKPIVVIQPKGKAMEKSSDDVPIGG
jgi:hypothetical protein